LDKAQLRLYTLIWQRAVGSQMASAEIDLVKVEVASKGGKCQLSATASTVAFKVGLEV
jgi:DNA topoisomerase-1